VKGMQSLKNVWVAGSRGPADKSSMNLITQEKKIPTQRVITEKDACKAARHEIYFPTILCNEP